MTAVDIQRRFNYVRPTPNSRQQMAMLRSRVRSVAKIFDETLPECHEKYRAITALDDALLQGIAAISREGCTDGESE